MANQPVTAEDEEAVRRLHAAGKTRNQIGREIGRSPSTVSKLALKLGLGFDREATAAATAAKTTDLAARRVALAERLHDDAERLRLQLWQPHIYFDWGGKDHEFDTHKAPEPTPADKRSLMGAVSVAVDKSLKLAPPDTGDSSEQVRSMLGAIGEALTGAFGNEEAADDSGG